MPDKHISVIVPAHNEEKLLPEFAREVTSYLEKNLPNYELLIVENGSTDKTLEIAKRFAQKNKRIKVYHLPKPSYGEAALRGFKEARGSYIIFFNVDFWDRRFIDLVKVDLLGYDVIAGSKNLPGSRDERPFSRRFISRGLNIFLKVFFGYPGTDTHGIKVFHQRRLLPILKRCKTKTGIFDSELLIRAQRKGLKILELPVEVVEKRPSRFGVRRILETPRDIWQLCQHLR